MLKKRKVGINNINNYSKIISLTEIKRIKKSAEFLKNKKIVHVNSTPIGGGVAERLKSKVPLERSLGIDSSWYYIEGNDKFFKITKKIHDGLQGDGGILSKNEKKHYLEVNKEAAEDLKKIKADLIIIHDPQPLAIANFYNKIPMILRIHVDLSDPNLKTLDFLNQYFKFYKKIIFSLPEYVFSDCKKSKIFISTPAIDPLAEKNKIINPSKFKKKFEKIGINLSKPLIAQISRFDVWKNPIGVLESFFIAQKSIPGLQLVLLGNIEAKDDPNAYKIFNQVKKRAKGHPNIFLFPNMKKVKIKNDAFVNMLQNCANPILQLSIKEGFGMTVTEAMWHGKVVIGGNVGGIKYQIKNKINGFLVDSPKQAAKKIVQVLQNPKLIKKIGKNAHVSAKKKFLITRSIKDYLKIYNQVIKH